MRAREPCKAFVGAASGAGTLRGESRSAEGAALLVDHVLPAVSYRVLSFPGPMAVRLGYDARLLAAIPRPS